MFNKLKSKQYVKLNPQIDDRGVIVVGGRTERWMQATWNRQRFILLPKDHLISTLIIRYEHKRAGHLGVDSTKARVRSTFWIIGLSRTARSIVKNSHLYS